MRISDWSSDVCSSDLGRLLTGVYWRLRFTGAGQWPAGSTGEDMQTDETYVRQGLKRVDGWLFPYSVDFIRSLAALQRDTGIAGSVGEIGVHHGKLFILLALARQAGEGDRKSTRLNSSH